MCRRIIVLLIVSWAVGLVGCATTEDKMRTFKATMGHSVGKPFAWYKDSEMFGSSRLVESNRVNAETRKYTYKNIETSCIWYFLVNTESTEISGWGYISDPVHCSLIVRWEGPYF